MVRDKKSIVLVIIILTVVGAGLWYMMAGNNSTLYPTTKYEEYKETELEVMNFNPFGPKPCAAYTGGTENPNCRFKGYAYTEGTFEKVLFEMIHSDSGPVMYTLREVLETIPLETATAQIVCNFYEGSWYNDVSEWATMLRQEVKGLGHSKRGDNKHAWFHIPGSDSTEEHWITDEELNTFSGVCFYSLPGGISNPHNHTQICEHFGGTIFEVTGPDTNNNAGGDSGFGIGTTVVIPAYELFSCAIP